MDIFVYRNGSDTVEEHHEVGVIPDLLKDENLIFWVDFEGPTDADDHVLLDVFKFHPLTVEDCRATRHHPKVEEFPDYLYFIVHAIRKDASPDRFNTVELDGFLGRNYVVTYHHEPFSSVDKVKQSIRVSPVTCQRGAPYILHFIIDNIVDEYLPVMDDFDERINALEDDIFSLGRANKEILEEILGLKRSLLRVKRISSKQLEVLYRMSHGQFDLISGPVLPFFRGIFDHLLAERRDQSLGDAHKASRRKYDEGDEYETKPEQPVFGVDTQEFTKQDKEQRTQRGSQETPHAADHDHG